VYSYIFKYVYKAFETEYKKARKSMKNEEYKEDTSSNATATQLTQLVMNLTSIIDDCIANGNYFIKSCVAAYHPSKSEMTEKVSTKRKTTSSNAEPQTSELKNKILEAIEEAIEEDKQQEFYNKMRQSTTKAPPMGISDDFEFVSSLTNLCSQGRSSSIEHEISEPEASQKRLQNIIGFLLSGRQRIKNSLIPRLEETCIKPVKIVNYFNFS